MKTAEKYTLGGDELLIAVFHHFPKNKFLDIGSDTMIMLVLAKAERKDSYKEFFKAYPFDRDGLNPHCKELATGLEQLRAVGLVSRRSIDMGRYWFSAGIDIRFEKFIKPKLSPTEEKLLRELAGEVKASLLL